MPDITPATNTAPSTAATAKTAPPVDATPKVDPKAQTAPGQMPVAKTPTEADAVNQGEAAVRKFKLKVDGQEIELPENEVILRAQKSSAAEKRFQEAQQTKAQAEAFINMLRTNFTQLLDDPRLGFDDTQKREMLEKYYKDKYIDPQMLSPEQIKQKQQEAELNRYRQQEEERKNQEHQTKLKQLEDFHRENFQKTIITALSTEGLPKTEFTVRRMADLMSKNLQMGLDLPAEHLAALVREDYIAEQKTLFTSTDGDTLLKLMGDEIVNKIRKADLDRLRAGQPNVPQPVVETPKASQTPAQKKVMSMDEMRAERDRRVAELQQSWKKSA